MQGLANTNDLFDIQLERTTFFVFRSAESLLFRADPLRAVQHRRHAAGHGC